MIKFIIFDFDGTLVNTLPLTSEAVRRFLKYKNINKTITDEDVLKVMSLVGNEICQHFMYPEIINMDEYNDVYKKEIELLASQGKPFPNVISTLKTLKQKGIKLYILSNKNDETVKRYTSIIFGNDIFIDSQGVVDNIPPKPSPDLVEYFLNKNQLNKEEGLFIGDSEIDLETAINCHMKSVIMSYGYADKEKMKKLPKPDYLLSDFKDIVKIIN